MLQQTKVVEISALPADVSCISPHLSFLGSCCGFAESGSHPWPVSGPSPVWTGPPCHAGCTCSRAAAQGTQRTCIWGHSPTTLPTDYWLLAFHQEQQQKSWTWAYTTRKKCLTEVSSSRMSVGYMNELWVSVITAWVDSSCCTPQSSLQAHQLTSRYHSVWLAVLRVNDRVLLSVLLVLFSTRTGREWVKDTVGSGNIWWARQTEKGSLKISRKQERVKIQDRAGYFTLEGQTLVRVEMYYVWGKQYLTALLLVRVR